MVLLIDSREQKPLRFPVDGILTETKRVTLVVGDYGAEFTDGSRPPLIFERKNLSDLFGTMGKRYKRFKREMERAEQHGIQLVLLIEGTLGDVYNGVPRSQIRGESMVSKLFTLWTRYNLQPVFCPSRLEMAAYIRESFYAIGRNYTKGKKA